RAQTQRGPFGKTWWAGRWLKALDALVDEGRLSRGRSYARSGQVTKLDVAKTGVDARVQGSQPSPYTVSIHFKQLSNAEWNQVYDVMASEAIYAAKLLSGEMPSEIENAFAAAGAALFPTTQQDLETSCSCPDWSNPCKHVAAVYYLLGERFDADPFQMFLLRGRSGDEVTAELRKRRGADDAPTFEEQQPELAVPLLDGPAESFWLPRATAAPPAFSFDAPYLDALPVKSLGPPPFWNHERPFAAVMEELYRPVSAYARELAFGDDETATVG
ncbi:MAG: SWIM zinc finger family protein, partial [Dehalococcoidia bacterium]